MEWLIVLGVNLFLIFSGFLVCKARDYIDDDFFTILFLIFSIHTCVVAIFTGAYLFNLVM